MEAEDQVPVEEQIVLRYTAGESGPALAVALKVPLSFVYSTLHENRVQIRSQADAFRQRDRRIRQMDRDGFPQAEIARVAGISRQRVHQIVKQGDRDDE